MPCRSTDVIDLEITRLDQLNRCAVTATARSESAPGYGEAVLPGGERRRLGADVLDEQQLTVGAKYSGYLPQSDIGRVDRAQDERRDDRVDRAVVERQALCGCAEHLRRAST